MRFGFAADCCWVLVCFGFDSACFGVGFGLVTDCGFLDFGLGLWISGVSVWFSLGLRCGLLWVSL